MSKYSEISPPEELAGHVWNYWRFETDASVEPGALHRSPPDACFSLAVASIGRASVVGPSTRSPAFPSFAGVVIRGARFWPDTGAAMLGIDAPGTRDTVIEDRDLPFDVGDLIEVSAAADDSFFARMSTFLASRTDEVDIDHELRSAIVSIIASRGTVAIEALSAELSVSPRTLQRRFRHSTGVTPKQFARVIRFREVMKDSLKHKHTWSEVAAEMGYADHSHLVRDARRLVGLPPGDFAKAIGRIEHGRLIV